MGLILRKARQANWYPGSGAGERDDNQVAADDFIPDASHKVSVWAIDSDHSNFERVVAALAGNREHVKPFDYLLFPDSALNDPGIPCNSTEGQTPDHYANQTWHADIEFASQQRILDLVAAIKLSSNPDGAAIRIKRKEVVRFIANSVTNAWIEEARLAPEVRAAVTAEIGRAR